VFKSIEKLLGPPPPW